MAAKSTTLDSFVLDLILNGGVSEIGNMAANAGLGTLYISLHTFSPGADGSQTTNEVSTGSYAAYARQAITRSTSSSGWTVSSGTATLANTVSFPAAGGGDSATITYFGLGTVSSGGGTLLYFGAVSPSISVTNGVTPQILSGSTISET